MHYVKAPFKWLYHYFSRHPLHFIYSLLIVGTAYFLAFRMLGIGGTSAGVGTVLALSGLAIYPLLRSLVFEYINKEQ